MNLNIFCGNDFKMSLVDIGPLETSGIDWTTTRVTQFTRSYEAILGTKASKTPIRTIHSHKKYLRTHLVLPIKDLPSLVLQGGLMKDPP